METILPIALVLIGPAMGSFAHLAADRFVAGRGVGGRSACEHCGRRLAPRDLVPLWSWLVLRGQSRCCGRPLRISLIAAEFTAFALVVWAVAVTEGWALLASALLAWTLLWLALVDLACHRLPDIGTLPLILVGLALSAASLTGPVLAHALGAALGFAALAGIAFAYARLRGRVGLGLGDAKLLAAAGAWTGAGGLPSVLLIGCAAGLVHALAIARGRLAGDLAIPFGPALALGVWVTWLHGPIVLAMP